MVRGSAGKHESFCWLGWTGRQGGNFHDQYARAHPKDARQAQDRGLFHAQPRCPRRAAGHENDAFAVHATEPDLFGQRRQQALAQLLIQCFQSRSLGEQAAEAAAVGNALRAALAT